MHSVVELSLLFISLSVRGVLAGDSQTTTHVRTTTSVGAVNRQTKLSTIVEPVGSSTTTTIGSITSPVGTSVMYKPIVTTILDKSAKPTTTGCVPEVEEYICDDDAGSEYTTTVTRDTSGCPSSRHEHNRPSTTSGSTRLRHVSPTVSPHVPSASTSCNEEENHPTSGRSRSQPTSRSHSSHSPHPTTGSHSSRSSHSTSFHHVSPTASAHASRSSTSCNGDESHPTSGRSRSQPTSGSHSPHSSHPTSGSHSAHSSHPTTGSHSSHSPRPTKSSSSKGTGVPEHSETTHRKGHGTLSTTKSRTKSSTAHTTVSHGKGSSPTTNGSLSPTKSAENKRPQFTGAADKKTVNSVAAMALGLVGIVAAM